MLGAQRASPADLEYIKTAKSVAGLTSLILQQQELESRLCTLEGMLKAHSAPSPTLPTGTPLSPGPFTGRLASVLTADLSGNLFNSLPPTSLFNDGPSRTTDRTKPGPLRIKVSHKQPELPIKQSTRFKKTVDTIMEGYQSTALKLAEVELKMELAYSVADRRSTI